jgi:hypothetical protein
VDPKTQDSVTTPTTSPTCLPSESATPGPSAKTGAKRLTIAVLVDNANFFDGCYEASLREALDAKCRREGHNLLLLYGGALDAPGPTGAADNTMAVSQMKALRGC